MGNDTKRVLSEEYLRKFKHRTGYIISESPKYRSLVGDNEEFDNIPVHTNEAGEQQDAEKPEGEVPPEPSNDVPQGEVPPSSTAPEGEPAVDTPVPEFDANNPEAVPTPNPEIGQPENQVDEIQNEIIKHNLEAMKGIHSQLDSLNSTIQGLNSKIDSLNADVEEVREPTDAEKLLNKSEVSYPYYFNLNDLWQDNWFEQKRGTNNENNGMRELPDGSYVADFDDLPQKSNGDIQDSFNDVV